MKKVMQVQEVEGEGLESLLGQYVLIYSINYLYSGKLMGVNTHDILLEEASIVYDTGDHFAKSFARAEPLPSPLYVRIAAIESYQKRNF